MEICFKLFLFKFPKLGALQISFYTFFLFFSFQTLQAQQALVKGQILDEEKHPLEAAIILIKNTTDGTVTDALGNFNLKVPANQAIVVEIRYSGFTTQQFDLKLAPNQIYILKANLKYANDSLAGVVVEGIKDPKREQISLIKLNPKSIENFPSAYGDFNKILATLGAQSRQELSSTYAVRGGNFDENLVYVNDMAIYRPFLVRAGQQEGLSFVNPNLVSDIEFSTGGWQAKYGDKLSSVLNIQYKKPEKNSGSVSLGILNSAAHVEGVSKNKKLTYVIGARRKSSSYLLSTLPVKGQYLPQFFDLQGFINYKFSDKTELGLLFSYAQNKYLVKPTLSQTTFGTLNQTLRLNVAFEGQEILKYGIFQNGLKLTHHFNKKFTTYWIASQMQTSEREYTDLESAYRLCEINAVPGSNNFNECMLDIGFGTNYTATRNKLQAKIWGAENRSVYKFTPNQHLEFGIKYTYENIQDQLNEYSFVDSADYVTVTGSLQSQIALQSHRLSNYLQYTIFVDSTHTFTAGIRNGYWTVNKQVLWSPTLQYAYKPHWKRNMIFKTAIGLYQQPPFYRELRDLQGIIHPEVRAQKALHVIGGMDYLFQMWGRDFRLVSELYYKKLYDVIPYDIDNVRIRYFAKNNAQAFAAGGDVRISGEFIKGTESWFSLGVLSTKEDLADDTKGYIRRPSDQRITLGAYVEDHIPNNPTWRVHLNLVVATGLPFGIPYQPESRAAFVSPLYRRVDLGFSKLILLENLKIANRNLLKSLWIGVDILNLLGVNNTISYTWVKDVNKRQYAVPNTLSARFLNVRVVAKF